jgi:hypothetical protein
MVAKAAWMLDKRDIDCFLSVLNCRQKQHGFDANIASTSSAWHAPFIVSPTPRSITPKRTVADARLWPRAVIIDVRSQLRAAHRKYRPARVCPHSLAAVFVNVQHTDIVVAEGAKIYSTLRQSSPDGRERSE